MLTSAEPVKPMMPHLFYSSYVAQLFNAVHTHSPDGLFEYKGAEDSNEIIITRVTRSLAVPLRRLRIAYGSPFGTPGLMVYVVIEDAVYKEGSGLFWERGVDHWRDVVTMCPPVYNPFDSIEYVVTAFLGGS